MGIISDIFNIKAIKAELRKKEAENSLLKLDLEQMEKSKTEAENKLKALDGETYESIQGKISDSNNELSAIKSNIQKSSMEFSDKMSENQQIIERTSSKINELSEDVKKFEKQVTYHQFKINRLKSLYKVIQKSLNDYHTKGELTPIDENEFSQLAPTVEIKLNCMDVKSLRKEYRENEKVINSVLESYSKRYTTKSSIAIYNLMVIALKSELQNVLYNLKYQKLDDAIENIKSVTKKYLSIADTGNQTIAGTLHKFIDEIEYLFINAVKIEYNYYVKKEQAKQEQLEIRQRMKEEAEERKILMQQQKQIEKEEQKYNNEIARINETLATASDAAEIEQLRARIAELEMQVSEVEAKKEEITKLQNGKAGSVYVISNLGAFGDDVFKIGMTRRLDPQERINELGSASVPFKFDIHSLIFSENASDLETEIHRRLDNRRMNKVNRRKEFFKIPIEELEQLVNEIEPTAYFNTTMLAAEFKQSLSSNENYESMDFFGDDAEVSEV